MAKNKTEQQISVELSKLKKTFAQFRGSRTKKKNFLDFKEKFDELSKLGPAVTAKLNFSPKDVQQLEEAINARVQREARGKQKTPRVRSNPLVKGFNRTMIIS